MEKGFSQGEDLGEVIAGVKRAVQKANETRETVTCLQIEKLDLILKVSYISEANGKFNIKIPYIDINIGAESGVSKQELQTINITLRPTEDARRSGLKDLEKQLLKSLQLVLDVLSKASETDPKFTLETAFIELNFILNSYGSISIIGTGSKKSELANTIRLYLK